MDTIWKDMQIPCDEAASSWTTLDITVPHDVWRKIGVTHMAYPWEPWDDGLLDDALVAAFRALWPKGCVTDEDRETALTVSRRVCEEAQAALQAPLLMKYLYSRPQAHDAPRQGQVR